MLRGFRNFQRRELAGVGQIADLVQVFERARHNCDLLGLLQLLELITDY